MLGMGDHSDTVNCRVGVLLKQLGYNLSASHTLSLYPVNCSAFASLALNPSNTLTHAAPQVAS
jgi:hypothetical protein